MSDRYTPETPSHSMLRRDYLRLGAATIVAATAFVARVDAAPVEKATGIAKRKNGTPADAIRPFLVKFPDSALAAVAPACQRNRLARAGTVVDASQGVQLETMQALARYWSSSYNWRRAEAKLNAVPNFVTEIDGLDIHLSMFDRGTRMPCR